MRYRSHRAVPVVGVVSLVAIALLAQLVVEWISRQIVATGHPEWLPHLGTAGETLYAYSALAAVISYCVVPVLIFTLGYYHGKSRP